MDDLSEAASDETTGKGTKRSRPSLLIIAVTLVLGVLAVGLLAFLNHQSDGTPGQSTDRELTAAELVDRMVAAVGRQLTYTMRTEVPQDGNPPLITVVRFKRSVGAVVEQSMGDRAITGIVVGPTAYLKFSDSSWRADLPGVDLERLKGVLKGRYIKVPLAESPFSDYDEVSDPLTSLAELDPRSGGGVKKIPGIRVNGIPTIGVGDNVQSDDSAELFIADDGSDLLLLVRMSDGSRTLQFSEWGMPVEVVAPSPAESIEPDELARLLG